ncbi:MAG: P-loop NTPase [Clostridia bacterium]
MKKVITAIGNPFLNERLTKEEDIEILAKDIQYQEGIFEILEKYKKIDFLIISENLNGKLSMYKLIEKIKEKNKDIKIIFILEKEEKEIEKRLYSQKIYKIFYHQKTEIQTIINLIKNKREEENKQLNLELEQLKIFLKENKIKDTSTQNDKIPILKLKNKKYIKENRTKKVITILGTGGVGKSIFTVNLVNSLIQNNYKIAIIDFDILNNSLHTILGVNKYPEKIKRKIKETYLYNII